MVFHVSSQPQTLLAAGPSTAADFASYKNSQMALIKSRRTFNSVLNEPEVKVLEIIRTAEPDEFTWLDKHVMVDSKTGSEFIRVTIEGDNGPELLILIKAIEQVYKEITFARDNDARIRRHKELEQSIQNLENELIAKQKSITGIAELIGGKTATSRP